MQTPRDKQIVHWIGRLGAAGAGHVMRRFAMGRTTTYARLNGLVTDGLLVHRTILYGEPGLYMASAEGLRLCGLERLGVYRLSAAGFVHAREVASAAVEIGGALPGWSLMSERELRVVELEECELVGSAKVGELSTGQPAVHRPDLLVISPGSRAVAVEIELSIKARSRLTRICRGWARARHIDAVYYLAEPGALRAVQRAVAEVRAEEKISVLPLAGAQLLASLERREVSDAARGAATAH
jgi:hypothetical protein